MRFNMLKAAVFASVCLIVTGCVTGRGGDPTVVRGAQRAAWSLDTGSGEMIVAVSPVRQTLQIMGSIGTVVGAGITAAQDASHKKRIMESIGDYPTGKILQERLAASIATALGEQSKRVAPLGNSTGYASMKDAEKERLARLGREDFDYLLDVSAMHGVFGYEGDLVVQLNAVLRSFPRGRIVWRDSLCIYGGDVLFSQRLGDPTDRLKFNLASPRLASKENAVSQWTRGNGALFKQSFETAVKQASEALLTRLGLMESADGYYALGVDAMNRRDFGQAHAWLSRAHELAPANPAIVNAIAVNLAHNGQPEEALKLARELTRGEGLKYAPAFFNLALFQAEASNLAEASFSYKEALRLGMPPDSNLEKKLEGK